MTCLVDTSILARLANKDDPFHSVALLAVLQLHRRKETLRVAPQNLVEFRNVATRATHLNGLGLSIAAAEEKAGMFETLFPLLPETPDVFPAWKRIVGLAGTIGKQVHDARLVATCHVHGVKHLLTFNGSDFARAASHEPGVVILSPAEVVGSP